MTTIDATLVLWRSDLRLVEWSVRAVAAQPTAIHCLDVLVSDDAHGTIAAAVRERLDAVIGLQTSVHSSADNEGYAGGHNRLLAEAFTSGADAALVVNPDVALDLDAVTALVGFAHTRPGALLGPVLELASAETLAGEGRLDTTGIRWTRSGRHLDAQQGEPATTAPSGPRPVAGISGACLFVPATAYQRIVDATGEFFDDDFIAY